MMELLADAAAVAASFFLAFGGYYYSESVKKIGSYNVNAIRILFYLAGSAVVYFIAFGFGIPQAEPLQWLYLGLSAFCGLVFGDYLFFLSLKHISPSLTFLISSPLSPIFSAFIGFIFLGEKLVLKDIAGIFIVLAGLFIVLSKNNSEESVSDKNGNKPLGIMIAALSAVGQGLSMVFTKLGITGGADNPAGHLLNPITALVIRTFFGFAIIWSVVLINGKISSVKGAMNKKNSLRIIILGSLYAITAIWLLIFALGYTKVGIAATLGGMMPVMIIPIMYFMKKEKTGARGIIGSVVSIAGVAVLMLG